MYAKVIIKGTLVGICPSGYCFVKYVKLIYSSGDTASVPLVLACYRGVEITRVYFGGIQETVSQDMVMTNCDDHVVMSASQL